VRTIALRGVRQVSAVPGFAERRAAEVAALSGAASPAPASAVANKACRRSRPEAFSVILISQSAAVSLMAAASLVMLSEG
jgi:hypothetical protein